jgi:SAM-dependent methyltransferase
MSAPTASPATVGEDHSTYVYPDEADHLTVTMIGELTRSQGRDFQSWTDEEQAVLVALAPRILTINPPRRLLDVGAGHGRVAFQLAPYFSSGLLVEPDAARRRVLRRRSEVLGLTGAGFAVTDRLPPGFGPTTSVATLSHVLQHIPQTDAALLLERIADFVQPCGVLYVASCFARADEEHFALECDDGVGGWVETSLDATAFEALASSSVPGRLPVRFFTETTLVDLIEAAGFSVELITPFHAMADRDGATWYRDVAVTALRR